MEVKACVQCGGMFISKREHGEFCSTLCRVRYTTSARSPIRNRYVAAIVNGIALGSSSDGAPYGVAGAAPFGFQVSPDVCVNKRGSLLPPLGLIFGLDILSYLYRCTAVHGRGALPVNWCVNSA